MITVLNVIMVNKYCIWHRQSGMFVCLQGLGTKGTLHPLPTLQNNEPVTQEIETGCKPVLFIYKHIFNVKLACLNVVSSVSFSRI